MDDEIHKALSGMFTDKRFSSKGHYVYEATIIGTKVGVIVGSKGPRFNNYALGKTGYYRVTGAKQKNIIDAACVVFADGDNAVGFTFVSAFDCLELQPRLEAIPTRTSAFGELWTLTPSWVRGDFNGGDAW